MLQRYLLLWLSLLSLLAFFWSQWFVYDPFVESKPILGYLFAVTMFAIGWMLPRDEMTQVVRRWPTVLGGTAIQYTSMPLLAYAMGRLFGLDESLLLGVVMVGCVPGAMASNVLTMVARGNVSYSLSLTASATLLSPICVPLALWLFLGARVDFPAGKVSWQLCWMVVGPVLLGHLLGRTFTQWEHTARVVGSTVANLTILWIIAVVVALNRDRLATIDGKLVVALLSINLGGYLAGYFGGGLLRLPSEMRRALTLEIGLQNAGLGAVLATQLFPDRPDVAIPTALYTFGCMATGICVAQLLAKLGSRSEDTPSVGPAPRA